MKNKIDIQLLQEADVDQMVSAFNSIGWNKPKSIYDHYLQEQSDGLRIVFVAKVDGQFSGYVTLKLQSEYPGFFQNSTPEISDLNVLPDCRKKGIGTALINKCERVATEQGHRKIGIGVGMTADYGNAQRLYINLGYIPDGNGLHYKNASLQYGSKTTVDDDLVLYFSKHLPVTSLSIEKMPEYTIEYTSDPKNEDIQVLYDGLKENMLVKRNLKPISFFGYFIRDESGKVVGGCQGDILYGCLYVGSLWVDKSLRGRGYGTKLMQNAEHLAIENKCNFIAVNTMDWEALDLYKKLGFSVELERKGFDKDSIFYFLRKNLK